MPHGDRLGFGVHQHLMPTVQHNRLMIRMADLASDEDRRVPSLRHPVQVSHLRSAADRLLTFPFRHAMGMLCTDVNQFAADLRSEVKSRFLSP